MDQSSGARIALITGIGYAIVGPSDKRTAGTGDVLGAASLATGTMAASSLVALMVRNAARPFGRGP